MRASEPAAYHVDAFVHWECPLCDWRNNDKTRGGEPQECLGCSVMVYVPVPSSDEHHRIAKEFRDIMQEAAEAVHDEPLILNDGEHAFYRASTGVKVVPVHKKWCGVYELGKEWDMTLVSPVYGYSPNELGISIRSYEKIAKAKGGA